MIALDTNVLLRFLLDDDAEQAAGARRLLQRAQDQGVPCYVSLAVLCEIVWVLQTRSRLSRAELKGLLKQLVWARSLVFAARDHVISALAAFGVGAGGSCEFLASQRRRRQVPRILFIQDGKIIICTNAFMKSGATPQDEVDRCLDLRRQYLEDRAVHRLEIRRGWALP